MRKLILPSVLLIVACSILAGCRSYFLTYPYPWDYSKEKPQESSLVGTYRIIKLRLPSTASDFDQNAQLTLRADGTAVFSGFPEFDLFGQKFVCKLSGVANWKLDDKFTSSLGWSVRFQDYRPTTKPTAPECEPGDSAFEGLVVLSRHAPHRLYKSVGDPDSDTGIEFGRSDR